MKCNYPLCLKTANFRPVIKLPTVRTQGIIYPVKPDPDKFRRDRAGRLSFIYQQAVRTYELQMVDCRLREDKLSVTEKPTYMMLREVCDVHKDNYKFQDWFSEIDWNYVREAARSRGFAIPEIRLIPIEFKPMNWTPDLQYMELDRG